MLQISTSKRAQWHGRPTGDGTDTSPATPHSLAVKVRVATSHDRLNRALAANVDPEIGRASCRERV